MFDESRYGASAGGGADEPGRAAAQPPRVPQRSGGHPSVEARGEAQVFALGGNDSTLAVINSLRPSAGGIVAAHLIPLARTPLGIVAGDKRQEAGIPFAGLFAWIDRTFPPDDEKAFVASMRDLEVLARVGWEAPFPDRIDERSVVNLEDLPDDVADALAEPAAPLVQCAACRRLCVRDDFIWKEKQLCAWDYHVQVFGKRGPWREGGYEERHFETLPECAYVAPLLLAELGVEPVLTGTSVAEQTIRTVVNVVLAAETARPHMAVRTPNGVWVLREAPVSNAL